MSPREDLEKIRSAGKIIEEMENKYEKLLREFGKDVKLREPRGLVSVGYLSTHFYSYWLLPDECTDERIAFRDDDHDTYYLPILWVEDREAWWAQALKAEAEYQEKQKVQQAVEAEASKAERINKLQAELYELQK